MYLSSLFESLVFQRSTEIEHGDGDAYAERETAWPHRMGHPDLHQPQVPRHDPVFLQVITARGVQMSCSYYTNRIRK